MKPIIIVLTLILQHIISTAQPSMLTATSRSMNPNIEVGDLLLVDEGYYSTNPISRFDIVIFIYTENGLGIAPPEGKFIARVIALGGETVEIKDNRVLINGKALREPYKTNPCIGKDEHFPCANFERVKVPEGKVFLLGDNRGDSLDSRLWSPPAISVNQVKGKVIKVVPKGRRNSHLATACDRARNKRSYDASRGACEPGDEGR
ncbi:MAG TPA: signal peptidase I [Blastocatellia bacterium]|nr:signal peptidase I [Blastocatellia bacterium]